jgi:hypothetical protein
LFGSINMGNGEQSGSGGRSDWPVRLSGAAGGMVGGAVSLFVVQPLIAFPPGVGPFAFVALIGVGVVLGQDVGGRLFRPSSGGTPNPPPPV